MTQKTATRRALVLGGLGTLMAGSIVTASQAQPRPYPPIPPPRFEERPPPPGRRLIWQQGYWHWNGGAYDWMPGHWVRPPRPAAVWVPGRWVARRGAWVWAPAHWR